jgi:hypothetical protein
VAIDCAAVVAGEMRGMLLNGVSRMPRFNENKCMKRSSSKSMAFVRREVKVLGVLVEYKMGINLIAVNAMLHEKVFYSSRRPQARTCRRVVIDEVTVRN